MKKITLLLAFTFIVSVSISYAESLKMPDKHPGIQGAQSQAASSITGKVVETMNSGGYTYVNVEKNGKSTWVAVPSMKMAVGQEVAFMQGAVMNNFTSKTLGKTFQTIIFSSGVAGAASGGGSTGGTMAKAAPVKKVKVEKASGPGAYVVAELYEKRTELDKKSVVIRGQVVKVSQSIMGKNWLHLQDGSGDSSKGNDDIIVTTQDIAAMGDIVTATGTLYKDKDFGSGYKYAVIVEEAKITK